MGSKEENWQISEARQGPTTQEFSSASPKGVVQNVRKEFYFIFTFIIIIKKKKKGTGNEPDNMLDLENRQIPDKWEKGSYGPIQSTNTTRDYSWFSIPRLPTRAHIKYTGDTSAVLSHKYEEICMVSFQFCT